MEDHDQYGFAPSFLSLNLQQPARDLCESLALLVVPPVAADSCAVGEVGEVSSSGGEGRSRAARDGSSDARRVPGHSSSSCMSILRSLICHYLCGAGVNPALGYQHIIRTELEARSDCHRPKKEKVS